jgi:hypothetical protein
MMIDPIGPLKLRLSRVWRRVPVDVAAFAAIAVGIWITHRPYILHGMCWNDSSWYFHFGNRTLHGAMPYRDYVFQVGPLPIFVDAGFQGMFGEKYAASMYAALFVKIVRVFVVWLIVRRVAGVPAAALMAVFCALDLMFNGWAHHWSTQYAQLFFMSCGLFLLLATQAARAARPERIVLAYLALAGLCAGMVMSARQATTFTIAATLFGGSLLLLLRREFFTPRRLAAMAGGFLAALAVIALALAALGALGPAIQQMFLDAPEKKSVSGVKAILDALSGGAVVSWGISWWGGFLFFLGISTAIASLAVLAASRTRKVTAGAVAVLVVPIAILLGLLLRNGMLLYFFDLPRTFLTITIAIAVLSPARMRRWFGIEPVVAIGLGALPLASDWALEMSYPGRGWGDPLSLVPGTIILLLASRHLAPRLKLMLCTGFALIGIVHFGVHAFGGLNPFAKWEASDGTLEENSFKFKHPITRGLLIPEQRKLILDWLTHEVRPGSTCFIYGTIPVLYEFLHCKNPTQIDVTIPDFITAGDAERALAILRANPPEYLIAQESSWMNPPLEMELEGKVEHYSEMNEAASRAMHLGLRAMLPQYETVGHSPDILGPVLSKRAALYWDTLHALRLYRRKQ